MMKILDGQGRIFGKLNIIDFLVILVLFSFLPVGYIGYKVISKQAEKKTEFVILELNCNFIKLEPETVDLIVVGDKELDAKGEVIGEIISLGESRACQYDFYIDLSSSETMLENDLILKQIPARFRLKVEVRLHKKRKLIFYKNRQICKNSTIEFETDKYKAEVAVLFEEEPVQDEFAGINSTLAEQITFVSDKIKAQEANATSLQHMVNKLSDKIDTLQDKIDTLQDKIDTLPDKIDTIHKFQDNKINMLQQQVDTILSTPKINKLVEKERKRRSRGK